jgi:hypothetical protein
MIAVLRRLVLICALATSTTAMAETIADRPCR